MPVSRRDFLRGSPATRSGMFIAARGLEAHFARGAGADGGRARPPLPPGVDEIRISSNENPLGPGKAVLDAIVGKFPEAGRYPFNSTPSEGKLVATIAGKSQGQAREHRARRRVAGDSEERDARVHVADRGLVTAAPTFENCTGLRAAPGHPVTEVKVDSQIRLDLEAMLTASRGAGLVFFNNPNNPTATVHGAKTVTDFVERVRKARPTRSS